MVEISGENLDGASKVLSANKGKIAAGILAAVTVGGTVLYNVVNGPDESASGKAQVSIDGDFNIYTDASTPGNATMYINTPNGTVPYTIPQSPEFYQSIVSKLPNASREALGMADYLVDLEMVEGKDALVKFIPNGSGNESEAVAQSVYLPAADLEDVIKEDMFTRYIKPDLDSTHGVDGWELVDNASNPMSTLDSVEVNYLPFDMLNPIQNEEVEDVLGTSYSDRMMDILNVSMDKFYPVGNDTDNETRAANEEARVDYLALMDDVKEGKAKMKITYRLNDAGEKEAFGALQYEDHNMSKAVKLAVYETLDISADGVLGDGDGAAELDNFMATKATQQQPRYDAVSLSNIGSLEELREKMANWENETGRDVLTFDRERGLEKMEAAGAEYNVNMSYFRQKMDETNAKYFKVYDTFDTADTGAYVAFYGDVQVGLDENQQPIYEETILWDQPISKEMADVIEREFVRGY